MILIMYIHNHDKLRVQCCENAVMLVTKRLGPLYLTEILKEILKLILKFWGKILIMVKVKFRITWWTKEKYIWPLSSLIVIESHKLWTINKQNETKITEMHQKALPYFEMHKN